MTEGMVSLMPSPTSARHFIRVEVGLGTRLGYGWLCQFIDNTVNCGQLIC